MGDFVFEREKAQKRKSGARERERWGEPQREGRGERGAMERKEREKAKRERMEKEIFLLIKLTQEGGASVFHTIKYY